MLINALPPESLTLTALRNSAGDAPVQQEAAPADPAEGRWSSTEMLMALLVDEVRLLRWTTVAANAGSNAAGSPPDPVGRPGAKPRRKRLSMKDRLRLDPRLRQKAAEEGKDIPALE